MSSTVTSCGEGKAPRENPLLGEWDTPFGVPPFDKIVPDDFLPAFRQGMGEQQAEIDRIVNDTAAPGFANVILAYDRSGDLLGRTADVFFLLSAANTSEELQAIEEQIVPQLSAHGDGIAMNRELFDKVASVYHARGSLGLDSMQMRLVEKTYRDFVRAGAGLTAQDKQQLKQINEQLSLAEFRFNNHLLADNKRFIMALDGAGTDGLPYAVKNAAAQLAREHGIKAEGAVTVSKPSMLPFLTYSSRRDLREQLYKAYLDLCNHDDTTDNKQIVNDIIRLRTEKAHLLGYDSYAAYVLSNVMAKTPANVYALLDELWGPTLALAREELAAMEQLAAKDSLEGGFQPWDWWYYAEKVRKRDYDLDQERLKPYFSLDNVQDGVFGLANRLYGLTFRPIGVPQYDTECVAYEVLEADNTHLGVIYLDFYPRPGKQSGAWCGNFRTQQYRDGVKVSPVVGMVFNFPRPVGSTPALLSLEETETFFHEFGHALHSLFADVPYRGLAEVERDFVELPSQIMENWAVEPDLLRRYAVHYQNKNVIPDELIGKIQKSARFNQGFNTAEYLAASFTDMDIHTMSSYEPFDVNAFERESLYGRRGLITQIEPRYRYPYFSHIFGGGYAAGYYGYIWAEVLDKDAFEAFRETGDVFDRSVAARLRREILSKGGTADGMTLYRNFRSAEPDRLPLMRARGLAADEPGATDRDEPDQPQEGTSSQDI